MIYIVGTFLLITIIVITIFFLKFKKRENISISIKDKANINNDELELIRKNNQNGLVIQMEMLPKEIVDENKLVEITDSNVLTRINHLVPGLAQVGISSTKAVQATQKSGVLYKAVIPAGTKLTESKGISNVFRGMYHGKKGIKGHANLVPVEKGADIAVNATAAAMNVASLVVGQYYMTKINNELGEINDGISKVLDFQDNEYRSKVFSLLAHVEKIAKFQVEILENNELRFSKITQLDTLEMQSTELLGQTNLTLAGIIKEKKIDYVEYEKDLENIEKWHMYQTSLMKILSKISELKYTLHFGEVSREQCSAILPDYIKQVIETKKRLTDWHKDITEHLMIDTEKKRRKRKGFDEAVHYVPSLFKEDFKYRPVAENTVNMIESQSNSFEEMYNDTSKLYDKDVQLILKDDKVYYLPEDV